MASRTVAGRGCATSRTPAATHPNGWYPRPVGSLGSTGGAHRPLGSTPITTLESDASQDQSLTRTERRRRTADALTESGGGGPRSRADRLDDVVRLNMGVARSVVSRYANRGVETDDLLQVAYLALTRAARDFDPARDQDFLAYAVPTIRGEVKKYFRDLGWTVRPPRRVQETQARINRAEGELVQSFGRTPTAEEFAEHLDAAVLDVVEALAADGLFHLASLDRPVASVDGGSTGPSLGDLIREPGDDTPAADARIALTPALRRLCERDRRILYLRFFEQRTQQEIADDIGVTQMQVSRLLTRILRDLRADLSARRQLS